MLSADAFLSYFTECSEAFIDLFIIDWMNASD